MLLDEFSDIFCNSLAVSFLVSSFQQVSSFSIDSVVYHHRHHHHGGKSSTQHHRLVNVAGAGGAGQGNLFTINHCFLTQGQCHYHHDHLQVVSKPGARIPVLYSSSHSGNEVPGDGNSSSSSGSSEVTTTTAAQGSFPHPASRGEETVKGGQQNNAMILAAFQQPTTANILSSPIPYSQLTIGVMKETFPGENRVSITPESASILIKEGFHVVVESGAGEKASFSDAEYTSKGAIVLPGDHQIYANADILTKIRPPSEQEIPKLAGKTLVGMISPAVYPDIYEALAHQNTNVFALDCVPRMLSRAQAYDVLSSQANIAGYRAVVEAAEAFPRFFKGQMTAAGKVPPAKVLVLGAGKYVCVMLVIRIIP